MSSSPIPEICDYSRSILVDVVFSKEAYYPGGIMSCMLTLKKPVTATDDIYFEWLAVQIHGHVAVDPRLAILPTHNIKSKQTPFLTLPNIKSLESEDCVCLYQSTPIVLESDCKLGDSTKKYICQIRIPDGIPPSLKCSSVKYFHLFSIILAFPNSTPRTYITEFKVHLPSSYTQPDTLYDYPITYPPLNICKVMDVSDTDLSLRVSKDSIALTDTAINQDEDEDIYINNDVDVYNNNLEYSKDNAMHNDILKSSKLPGIYSITCQDKLIGKIRISTNNARLGESIYINIDMSEAELKCLRVLVSLRLSQYLPAMNYSFLKEKTVTHNSVNTLSAERVPIYLSVPSFSPPSITTAQIQLKWSLFFVFTVQHEYFTPPNTDSTFLFNPSSLHSTNLENIEWSIPINVFPPQPSLKQEQLGEVPMFLGDESIFTLSPIKPSIV